MQPVFLCAVPSTSACAASQPFALRIRKSTRPARKALTRAHRDVLRRVCRFGGARAPESRKQRVFSGLPPPNHPEVFRPLHSMRCKPAEALLRCSGIRFPMEQDGQSRRRAACGELLGRKQKGRRFRLPVGCFMVGIRVPPAEREAAGAFPAPLPALRRGNLCLRCSPGTDTATEVPAVHP